MTPGKPVRCGIIGLGRMGQNHLRVLSLLKGAEIGFVYDKDPDTTQRIGQSAGVPAADDWSSMLGEVDAVIIASPTTTHADYIFAAAGSVRNIFVEKPVAETSDRAFEVAAFAAERGLNIQVGFVERFNPAVQQLKQLLDRSREVVSVDFARTNKISARITDVDVVADLMIHDIDLALHLNGPASDVAAHGIAEGGMIDFASALLTHRNGRFSRIMASRITDKKMRMIQATCRDMFVDCDLLRKEISITRQSEVVQPKGEPYTITALEETLEVRPQEALVLELQAFLQSCNGEFLEHTPGIDAGVEAMRICTVVQGSILNKPQLA
ncbi:Gfo/Idh/MocA family oxidoreductase [Sphingomonas sp.]|uniref:Gfo/Idh/MocA family protein n=1 Tax=Sphingomonas sp. TaxID=28214 RepID=UPI00286B89B9|nr:Gfo/Idh/MocA family oxidoreductase [Sphingomonas sp.]